MARPSSEDWLQIIGLVERWVAYARSRGWCPLWSAAEMRSAAQLCLAKGWRHYDARRSGAYTFAAMVLRQRIPRVYRQETRGRHAPLQSDPIASTTDETPPSGRSLAERVGRMAAAAQLRRDA